MTSASSVIHFSLSIRSTISRRSCAGSWIWFCALRKTTPSIPGFRPSSVEDVPVVHLELVAVEREERRPVVALGHDPLAVERRLRLLVGHLQEEQVRELLEVVAVREAVVAEELQ